MGLYLADAVNDIAQKKRFGAPGRKYRSVDGGRGSGSTFPPPPRFAFGPPPLRRVAIARGREAGRRPRSLLRLEPWMVLV